MPWQWSRPLQSAVRVAGALALFVRAAAFSGPYPPRSARRHIEECLLECIKMEASIFWGRVPCIAKCCRPHAVVAIVNQYELDITCKKGEVHKEEFRFPCQEIKNTRIVRFTFDLTLHDSVIDKRRDRGRKNLVCELASSPVYWVLDVGFFGGLYVMFGRAKRRGSGGSGFQGFRCHEVCRNQL